MKHVRKRLTYANVVASVALFFGLGGAAAIAANALPANSVGPRQLQASAVRTGYIDRNAVRTGKIAPEAVRAGRLAKDAVPTNRLRDSAVATAKIAKAAVTGSRLAPITTVEQAFVIAPGANVANATVQCPPNTMVINGGVFVTGAQTALQQSTKFQNGWRGSARNDDAQPRALTVQAYCMTA